MKDVKEAVEAVSSVGVDHEIRRTRRIEVGHAVHQGDVYLHRVPDSHPRGVKLGTRQVAVGTTVGSRHVVEGAIKVYAGKALPEGVKAPEFVRTQDILGPVVVAEEPFVLTHPEHAHHELPKGTYQTTYQADYSTRRAVAD